MSPRIMLVEDDVTLREIYMLKFELGGYSACEAENGVDALNKLDTFEPDFILLDLMMPIMGGMDFLRRLNQRKCSAKVIVFSNMSASDQRNEALALGASDYWIKSDYTPDLVLRRLTRPQDDTTE